MQRYESAIARKIRENHLEANVTFSASGEELSCRDRRYGAPSTTLKREAGGFVLESLRDLERGGIYRKVYADESEAVTGFIDLLLSDYRY